MGVSRVTTESAGAWVSVSLSAWLVAALPGHLTSSPPNYDVIIERKSNGLCALNSLSLWISESSWTVLRLHDDLET